MSAQFRLGIDAGGTFTDFVIADMASGVTKLYKTLSTPSNPTQAIEDGLRLIADDLKLTPQKIVSGCDLCINGTTVGLNALSVAAACGIPRETARGKLRRLTDAGWLRADPDGLHYLSGRADGAGEYSVLNRIAAPAL